MQKHIITTARGYIGTRFHHQGRLGKTGKHKGGMDCLGLLINVARDLDLRGKNGERMCEFDAQGYSHRPDTAELRRRLSILLNEVHAIQPADIVLFTIDGMPQHMGIATDIGIIHAYAPARAVVEHALDDYWRSKIEAIFRLAVLVIRKS